MVFEVVIGKFGDGEVYEYSIKCQVSSIKCQVPSVKKGFVSCNFTGIMV